MTKKSYPFSDLSESELDAIISRAQRQRAEAIAMAFIWLGRQLRAVLIWPLALLRPVVRRHSHKRHPLPH